jgi:hypothetical protein
MVLRRIFGQKRDEIPGEWKTLHNEELHGLYPFPNIISRSSQEERGGRGMWHAWEKREKSVQGLVGKRVGKITLGRLKRRWGDGIRMDLRDIGLGVWSAFCRSIETGGGLL